MSEKKFCSKCGHLIMDFKRKECLKLFVAGFSRKEFWKNKRYIYDNDVDVYSLEELLKKKEVIDIIEKYSDLDKFDNMSFEDKGEFLSSKSISNLGKSVTRFREEGDSVKKEFIIFDYKNEERAELEAEKWLDALIEYEEMYGNVG